MPRKLAIMTYGTQKDRLRAAAMARLNKVSVSEYILTLIKNDYKSIYGDTNPENLDARRE